MVLKNNDKINFIIDIHTTFSQALTGGLMALHYLAYKIAEVGHNVYIFCEPEFPHENINIINSLIKPDSYTFEYDWEKFYYNIENTVSIYPEITKHNPFNTKHVTRWILYHTQRDIEESYRNTDYYFNYGNFKTYRNINDGILTVVNYNFDKLYVENNNKKRDGFCHLFHKHTDKTSDNFISNFNSTDLSNWKTKGAFDYLRKEFNKHEYFLTYDQKSFFTVAAGLCGCKSIIVNPKSSYDNLKTAHDDNKESLKKITPTEYRLKNPIQMFGVSYGFEDIQWSQKTIFLVKDYLIELEKIDNNTILNFVKFWENKIFK